MRVLLHLGPYNLPEPDVKRLREACGAVDVVVTTDETPLEHLADTEFDVLVAEDIPHNLANWPRLRFVQLLSAGINHLSDHPIWQTKVVVANASGTPSVPIAQYVTCSILMMAHHMARAIAPATTRDWQRKGLESSILRGSVVGIVGYGSIGRECGRQLSALGMRIMCMKRDLSARRDEGYCAWPGTGDPEGQIPERWFGPTELHEMLPLCDALVITSPSTKETLGMVGRSELARMKQSAVLINVARGGIVDEVALAQAIRMRKLSGAVVDCFVCEPIPPDHAFFDSPEIILTPHISGVATDFWPTMALLVEENMRRFAENRSVLNRVNAFLGY